jgi:hypothetical protein
MGVLMMTDTSLVSRVDNHVYDAAQALDLASSALIRAQELAGQDTTGVGPARFAQATAMLWDHLRVLADMLTSPLPPVITDDARSRATRDPSHPRRGMAEPELHRRVEISDRHGTAASADVTITQQTARTARASLRAAAGHLAPGIRARLVDAVLDLPELHGGAHLQAAFPLGDSEILYRLRERCTNVTTHPAGATALLEANIRARPNPHTGAPTTPPPARL